MSQSTRKYEARMEMSLLTDRQGVSLPVSDARALLDILPYVIQQAKKRQASH